MPESSPSATTPATPERTAAELLTLARGRGLSLAAAASEMDRSGLDFIVLDAVDEGGARWVLRSPRRAAVVAVGEAEGRALGLVRGRLPVAAPEWRVHTPELIAYRRIEGAPAVSLDADGGPSWNVIDPFAPPVAFLDSFAALQVALQAISPDEARRAGVPVRSIDEVRSGLAGAMERTRGVLNPSEAIWARWHRWLENEALWPAYTALVHGDLHPGHLLLGPDGRLTGVLDWTEAQVTDPSIDFAMFHGAFGREALDAVVARFAAAGGRAWPRLAEHAVERWAAFSVGIADWGLRTDSAFALDHARSHLALVTVEG